MKRIINIFALLLCVCIVSCDDDSTEFAEMGLSVIERDMNISAAGGSVTVTLSAEGDKVVSDKDWCKVSIEGKMVTIILDANMDVEGRTAMVSVVKGGNKISFPVSQPSNKKPVPETESVVFDADATTKTIAVDHIAPFQVQLEQGITWLDAKVEGGNVVFTTQNNYTDELLSTTVRLVSGKLESSLLVTQRGLVLIPEKTEQLILNTGGEVTIQVNSTRAFTAVSDAEWLTVTSDDSSVTLTAGDNTGKPSQKATVTLTSENLTATIEVVQRAPLYAEYLGSWTLTGPNGRDSNDVVSYNLSITESGNNTYSISGWGGGSPLSALSGDASVPIKATFDPNTGAILVKSQPNVGPHIWNNLNCVACFQGVVYRNGGYTIITGAYLAYTGMLQADGSVKWENGSVTLDGGVHKLIGAGYYFIEPGGGYRSYNADKQILDPTMTKKD